MTDIVIVLCVFFVALHNVGALAVPLTLFVWLHIPAVQRGFYALCVPRAEPKRKKRITY